MTKQYTLGEEIKDKPALKTPDHRVEGELKAFDRESKPEGEFKNNAGPILQPLQSAVPRNYPVRILRALALRRQRSWLYLRLLNLELRIKYFKKFDLTEFQQKNKVIGEGYRSGLVKEVKNYATLGQTIRGELQFIFLKLSQWRRELDQLEGSKEVTGEFDWQLLMTQVKEQKSISIEPITDLLKQLNDSYQENSSSLLIAARAYDDIGESQQKLDDEKIIFCQDEKQALETVMPRHLFRGEQSLIDEKIYELKHCVAFEVLQCHAEELLRKLPSPGGDIKTWNPGNLVRGKLLIDKLSEFLASITRIGYENIKRPNKSQQNLWAVWTGFLRALYDRAGIEMPEIKPIKLTEEEKSELEVNLLLIENRNHEQLKEKKAVLASKILHAKAIQAGLGAQNITLILSHLVAFHGAIVRDIRDLQLSRRSGYSMLDAPLEGRSLVAALKSTREKLLKLTSALDEELKETKDVEISLRYQEEKAKKLRSSCLEQARKVNQDAIPGIVDEVKAILTPPASQDEKIGPSKLRFPAPTDFYRIVSQVEQEKKFASIVEGINAIDPDASMLGKIEEFKNLLESWFKGQKELDVLADESHLGEDYRPMQRKVLRTMLSQQAQGWCREAQQKDERLKGLEAGELAHKSILGVTRILGIESSFFESLIGTPGAPGLGLIKKSLTELEELKKLEKLKNTSNNIALTYFGIEEKLIAINLELIKFRDKPNREGVANLIGELEGAQQQIIFLLKNRAKKLLEKSERDNVGDPLPEDLVWANIMKLYGICFGSLENCDTDLTVEVIQGHILEQKTAEPSESEGKKQTNFLPSELKGAERTNSLVVKLFREIHQRYGGVKDDDIKKFLEATKGVQEFAITLLLMVEGVLRIKEGSGERVSLKSELYRRILNGCEGKSISAKQHFIKNECSRQISQLMKTLLFRKGGFYGQLPNERMPSSEHKRTDAKEKEVLKNLVDIMERVSGLTGQLGTFRLRQAEAEELRNELEILQGSDPYSMDFSGCVDQFIRGCQRLISGKRASQLTWEELLEPPYPNSKALSPVLKRAEVKAELKSGKGQEIFLHDEISKLESVVSNEIKHIDEWLRSMIESEAFLLGLPPPAPVPSSYSQSQAALAEIQRLTYFDPDNKDEKSRVAVPQSLIDLSNSGSIEDFMEVWFSFLLTSDFSTFLNNGSRAKLGVARKREVLGAYLQDAIRRSDPAGNVIKILGGSPCFKISNPLGDSKEELYSEIVLPLDSRPTPTIWHTLFMALQVAEIAGASIPSSPQGLYEAIHCSAKNKQTLLRNMANKLKIKICVFSGTNLSKGNNSYTEITGKGAPAQKGILLVSRNEHYYPLVSVQFLTKLKKEEIISLFRVSSIVKREVLTPDGRRTSPRKRRLGYVVELDSNNGTREDSSLSASVYSESGHWAGVLLSPRINGRLADQKLDRSAGALSPPRSNKDSVNQDLDWGAEILPPADSEEMLKLIIESFKNGDKRRGVRSLLLNPMQIFIKFLEKQKDVVEKTSFFSLLEPSIKKMLLDATAPVEGEAEEEGLAIPSQKKEAIRILTEQFFRGSPEYDENKLIDYIIDQLHSAVFGVSTISGQNIHKEAKEQAKKNALLLLRTCPIEIFIKVYAHERMAEENSMYISSRLRRVQLRGATAGFLVEALEKEADMPPAKLAAVGLLIGLPCQHLKLSAASPSSNFFQLCDMKTLGEAVQMGLNILEIKEEVPCLPADKEMKVQMERISGASSANLVVFYRDKDNRLCRLNTKHHDGAPTIYLQSVDNGGYRLLIPTDWFTENPKQILIARDQMHRVVEGASNSIVAEFKVVPLNLPLMASPSRASPTSPSADRTSGPPERPATPLPSFSCFFALNSPADSSLSAGLAPSSLAAASLPLDNSASPSSPSSAAGNGSR